MAVIAAGPAVNFVIAFVILFVLAFSIQERDEPVGTIQKGYPADGKLADGRQDRRRRRQAERGRPKTASRDPRADRDAQVRGRARPTAAAATTPADDRPSTATASR